MEQTLIATMDFPKQNATLLFRIVLYKIEHSYMPTEFVTWWEATETGSRMYGHYFGKLSSAMKDFRKRCAEPMKYVEGQEERGEI